MTSHFFAFFRYVPRYVFLILFIASSLVAIYSLRQNNLTMVKLREAVYEADKNGGDVNKALNELRRYVHSHINTDLSSGGNNIKPPIQLKYTYERLAAEAQKQANDSDLYTEAANYCQERIPASVSVSGRSRVDCVADYILSHGGNRAPEIPKALYQFDFVSPTWSPDLAGWSLVLAAVFLILFIAKLIFDRKTKT
jgi:hypothetical protein